MRCANGIETRGSGASSIHRPQQPAVHHQLHQVWTKTKLERPISARLYYNPRAWRPRHTQLRVRVISPWP